MGSRGKQPPLWIGVPLGVVVMLLFGYLAYQNWSNDHALKDRGKETTAEVVQVAASRKHKRDTVRFTTEDGRQVESLIGQGDSAPDGELHVGDRIPIVYDPQNPSDDVSDARARENHSVAIFLLIPTVICALVVAFWSWKLFQQRRSSRVAGVGDR
ncbi:DUF3592 domain-containing protein [Cryptosporangium sp. NPDC048952]|uniref:DUF3592 domain-containing protein n=1 Tax=Cryptosporangium sp. NPDC048952 TaxID=3363961 RepID=UPI00371F7544